jgi:hypothetical protein
MSQCNGSGSKSILRVGGLAFLIAATLLSLSFLRTHAEEKGSQPEGKIAMPKQDEKLDDKEIDAKGECKLPEGFRLAIAIQIGKSDIYWKAPLNGGNAPFVTVEKDGSWAATIVEGSYDPPKKLKIVLYAVGKESQRQIRDWVKHGNDTSEWPAVRKKLLPDDAIELQSVDVTLDLRN